MMDVSIERLRLIFIHLRYGARAYRKGTGGDNTGIKKRLAIFAEENPDVQKLKIDERALDQIESEFTTGRELSDFYKRNVKSIKKKTDFMIVQKKYFKVNLPNFLTWSEMEQIKELHRSEPHFWTYDKLSQSFPATSQTIKKIIESSWRSNSERIIKHDKQVSKNWEKLRKGEFKLDPSLEKHLHTFSSRENVQHSEDYEFVNVKIPICSGSSEFSKMITDYQDEQNKLEGKSNELNKVVEKSLSIEDGNNEQSRLPIESEIFHIGKNNKTGKRSKRNEQVVTLSELRNRIKNGANFTSTSELDESILNNSVSGQVSTITNVDSISTESINQLKTKYSSQEILSSSKDEAVPMKIKVPGKLPKDSVLRKKDVYYDNKGRFLYRVPGMKGEVD